MTKTKCPVCGANQSLVVANCAYCGSEIARAAVLQPEEYIAALRTRLENVKPGDGKDRHSWDVGEDRVRVIQMFTMPSNVECLVEFLTFCDGNSESGEDDEKEAWFGKAKAAYGKLRIASLNNPQLAEIVKDYTIKYSMEAEVNRKAKESRNNVLLFIAYPFILVIMFGALYAMYYPMWIFIKKIFHIN